MKTEADIDAIRRSLGLTAEDETALREAAPLLVPEIEGWVDSFYVRLVVDEVAMSLLRDEAMVVRLKRSLVAWFQELLTLPFDADYERARAEIGRVHVRIGMPQHLMVTAMGGVRGDVRASVARILAADGGRAQRVATAFERVLDLELALMLGAYRRRARELAQRTDRALYARRVEARFVRAAADAFDASLCYAELLRRAPDAESRDRWATRLKETLREFASLPARLGDGEQALPEGPRRTAVGEICARALENVSTPSRTVIDLRIEPPGVEAVLHPTTFRLAFEELLQNAVNHDPGGCVQVGVNALIDGGLIVDVTDGGPGWPDGVRDVADVYVAGGGTGLAFCEFLADLHDGSIELTRPPGGGAGVRIRLRPLSEAAEKASEDPTRDP
jgi:signal transduction histidine kinase